MKTILKRTVAVMLVIVLAFTFVGCKKKNTDQSTEESTVENTHKGEARSILTGQWVDEKIAKNRPVAVMLNNIIDAVPQTGIEAADVIYEAPVEGFITRLMGVFNNYKDLDKIGSVRSCRNYYLYFMMEFDAMYVHCGQSAYALDMLEQDFINNMSSLGSEYGTVFFQTDDRVPPHNTYTSGQGILDGAALLGYRTTLDDKYKGHYKFNEDDDKDIELKDGAVANYISPGYPVNEPWFEYNADEKVYYRYQYDGPHIDDANGHQLKVKNIIFQNCNVANFDDTPYLNIDCLSGGTGKYFTNGKCIDITWTKDAEYGVTHYYDSLGKEITINQGKTWVCIINNDYLDNVEIGEIPAQ